MKNRLLIIMLLGELTSFGKGKEPAIDKGSYTLSAAWGVPNLRKNLFQTDRSFGPISIAADRQLTKRFSAGLQYAYCYAATNRTVF